MSIQGLVTPVLVRISTGIQADNESELKDNI